MRLLNLLLILTLATSLCAQNVHWEQVSSNQQSGFTQVRENDEAQTIHFNLNKYGIVKVKTPKGNELLARLPQGAQIQLKGAPDLDKVTQSIMIHPTASTSIEVVSSKYTEYKNVNIAPSKGVLSRDVNPDKEDYIYGEQYNKDEFFPGKLAKLGEPYIIRNVRGQAVELFPLQYNAHTKTLRVYTEIEIKVNYIKEQGKNIVPAHMLNPEKSAAFENIYQNHFLNYPVSRAVLPETGGKMLIICYDNFASAMQPFIDWKTSTGLQVDLVNYSTIGSASAIKTYVANYYNNNGLTYLLLVGDNAQVPTSSTSAGDSDNNYGYIVGTDHYLDIFVGRFSAESASEVTTMVNRTIYYERDVASSAAFLYKGVGIASNEGTGGGGDNNESDEQHMNLIETDLQNYGYTISRCYQNGGSTSQLSNLINSGTGIINYVGHGGNTNWVAPNFSVSNVNALTNTTAHPFIISVACVVGNFKNYTCFAESWIRASNNGSPTGGLVFCGSTINQSWASPMRAQDKINDLLVANTYKNYGGLFVNGMFAMIDAYGTDGENMADTWTVFGDPSVQTRTPGHPNGPQAQSTCGVPTNLSAASTGTTTASVSWNAVSGAQSYTLAYKATTASNWTELSLTNTSYNLSALQEATTYQVKVKSTCSQGESAYSSVVDFTTSGSNYCTSAGNDFSYEWIAQVSLGTFTKNSTGAAYSDFTSEVISLPVNNNVDVSLTPGFKSTSYLEYWAVYIDFNQDKDFNDAGEEVFVSNSKSAVTGIISIPATATGTTRLRVVMTYNTASSPCGSFRYGETEDYTVSFDEAPVSYCDASGNDSSYEWIAGFSLGSFSNNSSAAGYTDFTGKVITVNEGASYSVALTPGFKSSAYTEYWKIWIDANKNGSFDDAGELLYSGNGSGNLSGTVTLPATIADKTRLRVVMQYNSAPSSCGSFSYGEVEDYTVSVGRALDQRSYSENLTNEVTVFPNPNNGEFTVSIKGDIDVAKVYVYNLSGQLIESRILNKVDNELLENFDCSYLSKGMYLLNLETESGNVYQKFVIE